MTDQGALKTWMYFKVFFYFKGKPVFLCLVVTVLSCGKAAAYLTSSLIAVSGSQGVVALLLPLAKPVIFLCNAFDLEGVHFTVESCGEMIRRKGEVQEKLSTLMVFLPKKKKKKKNIDKKFNSVSPSVNFRISRVSKVVSKKRMAVGNHPSENLR